MKAQDRELKDRYTKIQQGEIKLPRFQRHESRDKRRIVSLLTTIVNNLPLGVTLILQVGDEEKFKSRYISTADPEHTNKVTEHLLDGQQRLTAIRRTLNNNYETETYYIHLPEFTEHPDRADDIEDPNKTSVVYQSRWIRQEKKYPLRCNEPKETLYRGLVPTDLLSPTVDLSKAKERIDSALAHLKPTQWDEEYASKIEYYYTSRDKVLEEITKIRESIKHYNLPYLYLPATTDKETALQVFINMNTNAKPLSIYDIIVAEIEMEQGDSLHKLQENLDENHPNIKEYHPLSYLLLYTSALLQEKLPNQRGLLQMDKSKVVENWDKVSHWLDRMVNFLERQRIFDKQRLPTNAVLAIIATLYSFIPESWDELGRAELLLRKYLWSSFFTDRYENSAASRAYVDFVALKHILLQDVKVDGTAYTEADVPVLDREEFPISTVEELKTISRPKREIIRGRGILAVSHLLWAYDFADGQEINRQSIQDREYHHIYPSALLEKAWVNWDLALNCALITGKTNRTISDKDPMTYLLDRYNWVPEDIVNQRLLSHLIPIDKLRNWGYVWLTEEQKKDKIKSDFEAFLDTRVDYIRKAIDLLCEGKQITAHDIIQEKQRKEITVDDILELLHKKKDENYSLEFKSTLRRSTKANQVDKNLEWVITKTVNAFLNTYGGTLIIGITDDGYIHWLDDDYNSLQKKNKDGFDLQLTQVIIDYIWAERNSFIHISYHTIDDKDVCAIEIKRATKAVHLKKSHKDNSFYIRINGRSEPLAGEAIQKYIENHWGK